MVGGPEGDRGGRHRGLRASGVACGASGQAGAGGGRAVPPEGRDRGRNLENPAAVLPGPGSLHAVCRDFDIYKKGDRTRKIHHLIYAPDFQAVDRLAASLGRSATSPRTDGRSSASIRATCWRLRWSPARIPTSCPRIFGRRGSRRWGRNRLRFHPGVLWRPGGPYLRGRDRAFLRPGDELARLVPRPLPADLQLRRAFARQAGPRGDALQCEPDYFAIRHALETGEGYQGTVEFFPEEGKYHMDGHRACGIMWEPAETIARGGVCPVCGGRVTVGVAHRVEMLADRTEAQAPAAAHGRRGDEPGAAAPKSCPRSWAAVWPRRRWAGSMTAPLPRWARNYPCWGRRRSRISHAPTPCSPRP